MPASLVLTFAIACGLAVGNLYFAQPLLNTLAREFGVGAARAGIIVTLTQLGYACGLLLIAPLGDLLENRRLITFVYACSVLALLATVYAKTFSAFLAVSFLLGLTTVVAQMLVPLAAHLAPPEKRGRIVGQVMSGLLMGILLARAAAGIISGAFGWRAVYGSAAVAVTVMIVILRFRLPQRQPELAQSYGALLCSLGRIVRTQPQLRRRSLYQAALMAAFSVFWTGITFLLAGPLWRFTQTQIGLFAVVGAVGAMFTQFAGRMADRGHGHILTGGALLLGVSGVALTLLDTHLWALAVGAILLDLAVNSSLVTGQHVIYGLSPAERSRLNTVYIASFFGGSALGSALTGLAWTRGGWPAVVALGAAFPAAAFVYWLTEASGVKAKKAEA